MLCPKSKMPCIITPGLFVAHQHYRKLPRRPDCQTFLVPSSNGATHVCLKGALEQFNHTHLKHAGASPTSDQVRKHWFSVLKDFNDAKQRVDGIMLSTDVHSTCVQQRSYMMNAVEGQVELGNMLINTVIGQPVSFPTKEQALQRLGENEEWGTWLKKLLSPESCLAMASERQGTEQRDVDVPGDGAGHVELRCQGDGSRATGNVQRDKKYKPVPPEKLTLWEKYKPPPAHCFRRKVKVDQGAHNEMLVQLRAWQKENGKLEHESPFENEWYLDRRVELIQRGMLKVEANETIVKSYIKSRLKILYPERLTDFKAQRQASANDAQSAAGAAVPNRGPSSENEAAPAGGQPTKTRPASMAAEFATRAGAVAAGLKGMLRSHDHRSAKKMKV